MPIKVTLVISDYDDDRELKALPPEDLERVVDRVLFAADKHQHFTLSHHGPIEIVDEKWGQD